MSFMNIVSSNNEILNSSVSLQDIDGVFGLVMESRGGGIGTPIERNPDYLSGLDTLLKRLQDDGIRTLRIHIVSANALRLWDRNNRAIEIDGSKDILLSGVETGKLRGKICKAQQLKKKDPTTKGGNPTKRILLEANLDADDWKGIIYGSHVSSIPLTEDEIDRQAGEFSPATSDEAKERVLRSVAIRRGQKKFRGALLAAYDKCCAVTGSSIVPILEAAHIESYRGVVSDHVINGLLLRADIHTLFDLGLLGVNQDYRIIIASALRGTEYEQYNGKRIRLPNDRANYPSLEALKTRPLPKND